MIFLIRHATNDLVGKVIPGWMPGLHLNAEGREQADRLARGLRGQGITRVFSSPLERAMETAAPLAGVCGISVEVRERLGELPPGEFSGRTLEDLETDPRWRQFNQFRGITRAPGGELMLETQARIVAEVLCLREEHPRESVAAVSHADPIRAALSYFLGMPLDLYSRIEISPASVSVVRLEEWGPQVLAMNRLCE